MYLKQNLKPLSKFFKYLKELPNKMPIIIEKIIGDNGLISKPSHVIPIKSDKKIANKDVITHIIMPFMVTTYKLYSKNGRRSRNGCR